ncbi:MAG TPA: GAF domain-containing protein [Candidatus Binatia bacterium]
MADYLIYQRTIIVLTVMFCGAGVAMLWHMSRLSSKLVESGALQGTMLYSDSLTELRTFYVPEILDRIRSYGIEVTHDYAGKKRAIPDPATFTIEFGTHIGKQIPGMQIRLYSDYPFPFRKDGGPRDSFEKEALVQLRQQPNKPFYRFEDFQGRPSLRYATAVLLQTSCVACHNTLPEGPKTNWKVGDTWGVQEIIRPLDSALAETQSGLRATFFLLAAMGLLGVSGLALVIGRMRRDSAELEQRVAKVSAAEARLGALHEINQTILESTDLNSMMNRILEKTFEIMGFEIGMIRLLQPDRKTLEPVANRGYRDPENVSRQRRRAEDPVSLRVTAQVLATRVTKVEDLTQKDGMRTFKREGVRTMVTVPLRTQEDVLGVIHLGHRTERHIEPEEIRLLEAIGTQAGIGVQKIQLFEAAERRAREQEALNVIAAAASRSLDLNELFEILADKMVEVANRRRINFRLKDTLTGKVAIVAYRGFTEEEIAKLRRMTPHPMSEKVFASGDPLVINDRLGDGSAGLLARTQSVAWIPVKAGAKIIGVLGISDDESRPFSPTEVEFLQATANVIGVAIENARLFGQTKGNLEQIRALHEIGTAITSTLDLHDILKIFLEEIGDVLPYSASSVRLFNPQSRLLEPIACVNLDEDEWRAEQWRGGRGLPNVVFETKAPVMVRKLQSDPRLRDSQFFQKHGLVSYLGVPLFVRDETLGVLSFYTKEEREFSIEEIEFLSTLANHGAVAIHNSQLHEETTKQAAELEKSNAAKDEFLEVLARQKEELSRLNAGLECEIAERGRARAELAAKNRDLETLLYVTSHDLREPLRAIENFSRMINERYRGRLDDKGKDFLRRVILGSQRLNRLLDDILTLSRSQRMGAPTEEVDGESIVLETVKRLEGKINATDAQIHVAKDFGGLRVDKVWATQAVFNLIANALKFTRDGEPPEVEIAPYRPNGPDSGVIGIVVRDRGPGIAPEHAERIFQLFQRAVGREVEGTGAGLAIVRQIAERHGGNAWVEPRQGGGSKFIVTFGQSKDLEGGAYSGDSTDGDPLSGG